MFNLDFLRWSSLMGTTLLAVPSKRHAFSTNYHACIAMPTWKRCAPPILLWHWPPFNLFPSSCITWIFFVDSHWWVPLRVQYPTIYMPFRQIIMYILQCPHDIHVLVHLFCFDRHKFLLRSRAATCPTSNCGCGTSLFRQELFLLDKLAQLCLTPAIIWFFVGYFVSFHLLVCFIRFLGFTYFYFAYYTKPALILALYSIKWLIAWGSGFSIERKLLQHTVLITK